MALVKGTNSYVDLAEATVYFTDRLDVDAWDIAADLEKEKALATATAMLDNMNWTGYSVSDAQPLAFPRSGEYFDPRVGTDVILNTTEIPLRIAKATYELAYHLLNNDGLLDDTGSVDSLEVGSIVLTDIRPTELIPATVTALTAPLLRNRGAHLWWRAN